MTSNRGEIELTATMCSLTLLIRVQTLKSVFLHEENVSIVNQSTIYRII